MEDEKLKTKTNISNNKIISSAKFNKLYFWQNQGKKRPYIIASIIVIFIGVGAGAYLLISKFTNRADNSNAQNILTINDLNNPNVELTADTSDASVENLTNGLKAKIDEQIAAQENPIKTVIALSGVLSNTTNENRQDQLTTFIEDFLVNHGNALWFRGEYGTPDQAQVNYWKAELYAYIIYNFQFMMENEFTGADGKPIDVTQEELEYIDLYLALANDPASHVVIPEEDKDFLTDYTYSSTNYFLTLKNELTVGAAQ